MGSVVGGGTVQGGAGPDSALTDNALTDNALTDNALTDNALTDSALTDSALPETAPQKRAPNNSAVTAGAVLVLLNLPVPDDQRAWSQAEALRDDGVAVTVVCPAIHGREPGTARIDGIDVVYYASFDGPGEPATRLG